MFARSLAFSVAILLASGCGGQPTDPVLPMPPALDDPLFPSAVREVDISHDGCYGTCPVYRVRIDNAGSFDYEGKRFVRHIGLESGRLGPPETREIFSWIRAHPSVYESRPELPRATDGEVTTFRFVMKSGEPIVLKDFHGTVGSDLWVLSNLIERSIDRAWWENHQKSNSSDRLPPT